MRKKLHLGEFQQLGFDISFQFQLELPETEEDRFWDNFILEAVEANELVFGGGNTSGFVTGSRRSTATEGHREMIHNWLQSRREVQSITVGALTDAWHLPNEPAP